MGRPPRAAAGPLAGFSLGRRRRPEAYATLLLILTLPAAADVVVRGRVVDENGVAVPAARVTAGNLPPTSSNRTGRFVLRHPGPGDYSFSAEHEGYFALRNQTVHLIEGDNDVTLVLNHLREFVEQVDVS